jgi:hypothetical protein
MNQEPYSYANPLGAWVMLASCLRYTLAMKMQAVCSADNSADFFWSTQCHIPGDGPTHSLKHNMISLIETAWFHQPLNLSAGYSAPGLIEQ